MESSNTPVPEAPSAGQLQKMKQPIIGFMLMLAGPAILLLTGFYTKLFGYLTQIAANVVSTIAIVVPGIGFVIGIASLFKWKQTWKLGRAFALVTVVMCNPFFYFVYLMVCGIASSTLAGLSWM